MKKLIILFFILLLGFIGFIYSYNRYLGVKVYSSLLPIQNNQYSFSVYAKDYSHLIFSVSPFDDYLYSGNTKYHLIDKQSFKNSFLEKNLLNQILNRQDSFVWTVQKKDGSSITYSVIEKSGQYNITRTIKKLDKNIYAIGQSLKICDQCLVVDQYNRILSTKVENDLNYQSRINQMGLVPLLLIDGLIPSDVRKLKIIDGQNKEIMDFELKTDQRGYIDEKFRLIEIKSYINFQRPVELTQTIFIK